MVEPSKGPFNNPALGQHFEGTGFRSFDDLNEPAKHGLSPVEQLAGVPAIDKYRLNAGKGDKQTDENRPGADPVLNAG